MRKAFLKFMEHVVSIDCPFNNFSVSTYKSYIEVKFIIATSVKPNELGWLNTHLIGGRWFLVAEQGAIHLIIRFDDTNED